LPLLKFQPSYKRNANTINTSYSCNKLEAAWAF